MIRLQLSSKCIRTSWPKPSGCISRNLRDNSLRKRSVSWRHLAEALLRGLAELPAGLAQMTEAGMAPGPIQAGMAILGLARDNVPGAGNIPSPEAADAVMGPLRADAEAAAEVHPWTTLGGEVVGSLASMPIAPVLNPVRHGVAKALTSNVVQGAVLGASEYAEDEEERAWKAGLGGLFGAVPDAVGSVYRGIRNRSRPSLQDIRRVQMTELDALPDAKVILDAYNRLGVRSTVAEVLPDIPALAGRQSTAQQYHQGQAIFHDHFKAADRELARGVHKVLDSMVAPDLSPGISRAAAAESSADQLSRFSLDIINEAKAARKAAVDQNYTRAVQGGALADTQSVLDDLEYLARTESTPDSRMGKEFKRIRKLLGATKKNPRPSNVVGELKSAYEDLGAQLREIDTRALMGKPPGSRREMVAQAHEKLGKALAAASPAWKSANDTYARMSQESVNPLLNGFIGELAKGTKPRKIIARLLNGEFSPETVEAVLSRFRDGGKMEKALDSAISDHLRSRAGKVIGRGGYRGELERTSVSDFTGDPMPRRLYNAMFGNQAEFEAAQAAMPAHMRQSLEDIRTVTDRMSKGRFQNSQTARQEVGKIDMMNQAGLLSQARLWANPLTEWTRRFGLEALDEGAGKLAAQYTNAGKMRFATDANGRILPNQQVSRVGGNPFTRALSMSLQRTLAREAEESGDDWVSRAFGSDNMRF